MDYNSNEWRPVGRGDPLKNDPTFDYSPPTLDRVRYWADPDKDNKDKTDEASANVIDAKLKKANPGKNEILLLGVTGDRMRGTPVVQHPHAPHMVKNAKGETPLLQPKYTSIRRSYYAHQLPTHLMPPPMQPMVPATQQQSQQTAPSMNHMVKPVHTEYRHNMPMMQAAHHSYMSSSPQAMNSHSKPYHMTTTSSQPWMHSPSSPPSSMVSSKPMMHHMKPAPAMTPQSQHYSHPQSHDAHHQESMNYLTYSRPSMTSTQHSVSGGSHDYYSPNSIRGSAGVHKSSSRKPWIHDLLQKEFIKTMKPTASPNSYHMEASAKPPQLDTHFEPMLSPQTIFSSSTYAPVTFVTTTPATPTPAPTHAAIYVTSSSTSTTHPTTTYSPPIYTQTSTSTTQAPRTTTTLSPTRLLIPNTSNLSYRPTVSPMKMTTDSLFSHYHQPEKPLRGPMYLIIEGHSKVKTYGKDELDPHKPKIVPVISNREPVVRRADPNEKRGTPETFQVKHLHSKTTQSMEKPTTATPKSATSSTTKKPEVKTTNKPSTTVKPTTPKPKAAATQKVVATTAATPAKKVAAPVATPPKKTVTTTTAKPAKKVETTTTAKPMTVATTKPVPKLSVTTTTTTTTTMKPKTEKHAGKEEKMPPKSPVKGEKLSPNALSAAQKPSQPLSNVPPTAMQGLFSLLDSTIDTLFKEDPVPVNPKSSSASSEKKEIPSSGTTKLKSMTQNNQPQIEGRVSTKLQAIKAEDYDDDSEFFKATTEYLPRETRQIFDYDQLPESRITDRMDYVNYDEDDLSALGFDDEYEEDEEEEPQRQQQQQGASNGQKLIKRIDALVGSSEDLDDLDADSLADLGDDDFDALDLARQQKSKKA